MADYIFTRFRIRLTLPDLQQERGDKAVLRATCVRDTIQQFLDNCARVDPSVALAPWSVKMTGLPLRLPNAAIPIPTHVDQAKKYFHTINPYSQQRDMYFYLKLRHEVSTGVLLNNVERPFCLSLWVASLQLSEDPVKGGFFVYSHRSFANSASLINSIQSAITQVAGKIVEVAIYWGPVNMVKVGLNGPYALQIDVDSEDYELVKRSLMLLYNRLKQYPSAVPMVYVPPVNRCIDDNLLREANESQVKFLQIVQVFDLRCFLSPSLDSKVTMKPDRDLALTLGEFLRKGIVLEESPIFHSVIECLDQSGVRYIQALVMPIPLKSNLARVICKSPVAFFRHYLTDDSIALLFDRPSLLQGESDVYDPETRSVKNSDELQSSLAIRSCLHFDMQLVYDRHEDNAPSRQGESASYASNFSFDPGSIRTNSALAKRTRFSQVSVPGTSRGVSGEGL